MKSLQNLILPKNNTLFNYFDPELFDHTSLGLSVRIAAGAAEGRVYWLGEHDAPEPAEQVSCEMSPGVEGCIDPSTNSCGVCSGSLGPPNRIEQLGLFTAVQ